jgi:hypothetical protein
VIDPVAEYLLSKGPMIWIMTLAITDDLDWLLEQYPRVITEWKVYTLSCHCEECLSVSRNPYEQNIKRVWDNAVRRNLWRSAGGTK